VRWPQRAQCGKRFFQARHCVPVEQTAGELARDITVITECRESISTNSPSAISAERSLRAINAKPFSCTVSV
jgi:hypothetical protein